MCLTTFVYTFILNFSTTFGGTCTDHYSLGLFLPFLKSGIYCSGAFFTHVFMTPLNFDTHPDPVLARALSVMTSRVHIDINFPALELCKPVVFVNVEQAASSLRPPGASGSCFTWSPSGTRFFTLLRTKKESLVYCHDNDTLYAASPEATLSTSCPLNIGFVAQYYEDPGTIPRLLVFDIVSKDSNEESAVPTTRGEQLRKFAHVFPNPLCSVQWVGYVDPLRKFIGTLPHKVDCFLELTKDPFQLIRMTPW